MEQLNEVFEQARALDHHGRQGPEWRDNLSFAYKVLYIVVGVTVVVTCFVIGIKFTLARDGELLTDYKARIAALEVYKTSTDLTLSTMQQNSKLVQEASVINQADIKALQPKVDEMWWMKEHGITNIDEKRNQAK